MTPFNQRRRRTLVGLSLVGATALGSLVAVEASSHREAPLITEDPVADNTDVYAFVSPDDPDSVTIISNWIPFEEPAGGPNFYNFGEDVLYEINIDNDGDAVDDIIYEFRFNTTIENADTFLYATGPITSLTDPDFNLRQTYTVTKVADGVRTELGTGIPVPPNRIGPRSTPNYAALADAAITPLPGGTKVFAGQRDEGFPVDVGSIFDLGGLRPFNEAHVAPLPNEPGKNGTDGFNVHSIAIQVPTSELTTDSDYFDDDDGTTHEQAIDAIAKAGITTGTGGRNFSPAADVTRGQLARFIVNALELPASDTDAFDDDDGNLFEADINAIAAAGIVKGCGTRQYCPSAPVTRAQMATFLVNAADLPADGTDRFTDDNGNVHEANINALAAAGVTQGCVGTRYCPSDDVRRDQMGSFLARAFDVPDAGINPVIGIYSTTYRRASRVFTDGDSSRPVHSGQWVQVSRLGHPLVNEVVVPLGLKDAFNASEPTGDGAFLPLVLDPELARLIPVLYPGVEVPPAPRTDLVAIFLTGLPGVNQLPNGAPSEMLRLNTSILPTGTDPNAQNRLGLLGGENDGFPNGRRVIDDVTDIELQALAGATPFTPEFNVAPNNQLTDGANVNDLPFLSSFPYLALPHDGYENSHADPQPAP